MVYCSKPYFMYTYSFEKLEAWQIARKFVVAIYQITKSFPAEEKYGLVSQIRRAALSVCSNLAEGGGRFGTKDQLHFFNIAYSSLMEVLNQLIVAGDLGLIDDDTYSSTRSQVELLSAKIGALRNSRKRDILNPQP